MSLNPLAPPSAARLQPGDLLDPKETGRILKTAERTLANWRSLGKGPAWVRVGDRMVRYRRDAIDDFIANGDEKAAA